MIKAIRRIGRSLAVILPVVLVLSGTLAVARVPWAGTPPEAQMLTASTAKKSLTPQEALTQRLLTVLQRQDPSAALTGLQQAVNDDPSLSPHCTHIARTLGEAAVAKYGSAERAQQHARPVCDTAFASGVAAAR
ncbi:hypothetical protein [Streptomyces sp. 6N223]|uniref:hypothetical protein n=1 Tax=Streptomyces sp. 6N223 TaxID=3457412 RepID=UPI003FD64398